MLILLQILRLLVFTLIMILMMRYYKRIFVLDDAISFQNVLVSNIAECDKNTMTPKRRVEKYKKYNPEKRRQGQSRRGISQMVIRQKNCDTAENSNPASHQGNNTSQEYEK